ncbi:DUF7010 family protein [Marinicella litoralis]|uniref:Uncharacterized protein n=1 Tax=Marinicella litoralis TaxID=644220 RepID=A0A4R6XRS4_9GAMM|nr:hypothetical protein [Marinicella litoralis]TDR20714.1 hypothetical protein C8D91_1692 [Marinicella litoralis]
MKFEDAQKDMNFSYYGGGTGVLVSGIVWSLAGLVALLHTEVASMLTLFIGGMFIFPAGMLIAKMLKRPGKHLPQNPLGKLAIESTLILFVGLFLAYCVARLKIEWFYPIMLLTIGVRYLVFNTLYQLKTYWLLGVILMVSGMLCILLDADFMLGAFIGGITEIIFSFIILQQSKASVSTPISHPDS